MSVHALAFEKKLFLKQTMYHQVTLGWLPTTAFISVTSCFTVLRSQRWLVKSGLFCPLSIPALFFLLSLIINIK